MQLSNETAIVIENDSDSRRMVDSVLLSFGLENITSLETFGSGLINHTWKVTGRNEKFILQKINDSVFTRPGDIAHNIRLLKNYLRQHQPDFLFAAPVMSVYGTDLVYVEGEGFFRLFSFVPGSHSINTVQSPEQAYEAALQFGRFTSVLAPFDVTGLKTTIPDFHNLTLRYQQFLRATEKANGERVKACADLIAGLKAHHNIVDTFEALRANRDFKLRVTHHDTKISNVLFDENDKGICVIDLDTVMPGYFISDVGDMLRTYLSPANEEEADFDKIAIREEMFVAIAEGYGTAMKDELSTAEKAHFIYAGKFLIYMQALRFLTDYLQNDVYYGAAYEGHNFVRAGNQAVLLQRLVEKEKRLQSLLSF